MDIHPALLAPPAPPEPVSVVDVAECILAAAAADGADEMDTTRLQCLVYLSQGWHLAVTGLPLFLEPIEAWAEGPVVAVLAELYGDRGTVTAGFFYEKLRELDGVEAQQDAQPASVNSHPVPSAHNPER